MKNGTINQAVIDISAILKRIENVDIGTKIEVINAIREEIHKISPFAHEPVDFVRWVKNTSVHANDYNPNTVAPPEMELLRHSIHHDGYTQPIVGWKQDEGHEVIDGFHRHRVGKEFPEVEKRVHGYLPIVEINEENTDKKDRVASTIRHNRARGKHKVDAMSDIVVELKNRNWSNDRICRELGMDEDEVLRLCQITGLQDLFKDEDFSKSWDAADSEVDEWEELTDEVTEMEEEGLGLRTTVNTSYDRIFHTYEKWECHKAGFYANSKEGWTKDECEAEYVDLLSSELEFSAALQGVIDDWKHSCEHYLTNKASNRIAWLGQAAVCYARGIPSAFRSGYFKLPESKQLKADEIALRYLNIWLEKNGREFVSMEEAKPSRQSELY